MIGVKLSKLAIDAKVGEKMKQHNRKKNEKWSGQICLICP